MVDLPAHPLTLVACSLAHGELLASLHAACFDVAWSEKDFQELLRLPTVFGFILQTDNTDHSETNDSPNDIGGFILCQATADECEILTLGVLPQWRRQGLAAKLLQNLVVKAQKIEARQIFLEVADDNIAAKELYFAAGFKEVGRRAGYYQGSSGRKDALILAKTIFE